MFLICFFFFFFFYLLTDRIRVVDFFAWELCACVCVCVCVCGHQQAYLATENSTIREEKRGASSLQIVTEKYRWRRHLFSVFLCFLYLFRKSLCLPCEVMPPPQFQNMWLASAWLCCLRPPLPPPPAATLCPSGPVPQHRPIGREVRLGSAAPLPPVRTRAVVGSVHFSCSLFWEQSSGAKSVAFSGLWCGQRRGKKQGAGLCLLLVGFADWFAAIHDHWFAGCAYRWRAPGEFRLRLPYVVQRRLSVHCD